ncbi:endonuclease/exonuclease/phosphatase family protein [Streptomyces sp. NPDC056149]|uniref:endonuclease/exonuclease/phosphatase family protein n=1 Tax=unclassified Streptomyces TaxID=2593676 RepID=UPI0023815941|nr:endonuclease/exonuclease/phosphatase family protein [Streptomyces sp. WZ-12]
MIAVVSTVAALLTVPLAAAPARAVNGDGTSPFATYNMRGSDNGSRWRSEIAPLVRQIPVVALQEVGSGPPEPPEGDSIRSIRIGRTRPYNQPSSYQFSRWRVANGVDRYVYFMQTDPRRVGASGQDTWDGGRTNLATVSDTPADQVQVLDNPTYDPNPNAPNNHYRARPLLGLRFGNTWYWNTHARGDDDQQLLRTVRDFAARSDQRGRNWVLVGDFNINILNRTTDQARDQSLHLNADEPLLRTGEATYINGNTPSELDYAVTRGLPAGFTATRPRAGGSDHAEVHFARTPPPAQAPVPAHVFATVLATPTGNLLQENADRSIGIGAAHHDNNQTWRMYTTGAGAHFLRNNAMGDCVSLSPNVRRDASSAQVVAGRCDDPRAQWTITDPRPDPEWNEDNGGPQQWRNVTVPELCLTPSDKQVTATPCTKDAGQRWWDNAAALPKDWPTTAGNIRLESSWLGGRLRRTGSVPGTGVYTAPTPPKWWWIYWLFYERQDFGWNIQRISPDDNLVRIQSLDGRNQCLGARDEHATEQTDAVLRTCDDARGVDGAGQRWLTETYADGTIRYRNEATHLCLLAPDANHGNVSLYTCDDIPAERWNVVQP